ncbi:5-hydroxytryptamine receptor 2B [Sabethes cyaneus]|uniref:5-hydroxytryptamine receptor 2B n=1 Tax=Sabethes cyaneus TaxID=53552 RepID=UPI00237E9705|nr:5-hydroxytryptamine receptor 2B [Sabethes cyaneus]
MTEIDSEGFLGYYYYNGSDISGTNESGRFIPEDAKLDVTYAVFEGLVALMAVIGNAMVIVVFKRERRLRRRTNFYIISLATADFLVGLLGVPFAVLSSIGLPRNLYACLFTISLLIVLCTISIFCLVAVSVDRYWAILHPMAYSRNVRTKTAIVIISLCWLAGSIIGFLPLFGWHETPQVDTCLFLKVMDYDYLVFLYFATIITPALIMLAFYAHIYRVILKQLRQIVTMNPMGTLSSESRRSSDSSRIRISTSKSPSCKPGHSHGGTMLRVLGAAQKREVKATQNLSIIVLFFMICWIPLYTINCIVAFCRDCKIPPTLMLFCIILSHLNSAVNPLLYAYHLKDFRAALRNLILTMIGYDVSNQELNYRASLASQHQFVQRHSVMDRRLSPQPKIYVDSPVYLRSQQLLQQQQRHQQSILIQQHPLGCTESEASFNVLHKKRLITSTRSDPGSPNILISTSAISDSPVDSNCSTPQRYEMGLFDKSDFKMWRISEVSSVHENSGNRKSIYDNDDAEDHSELILVYTESKDHSLQRAESIERQLQEEHAVELVSRSDTIKDQSNETPEFGLRLTEEDCNHSSLYSFVLSKRRSQSTCCILQENNFGSSVNDPIFLIEQASPQRILTNNVSQPDVNNTVYRNTNCANHYSSSNLVDNYNNNCNNKSSPKFGSTEGKAAVGDKHQRPISRSLSLFSNPQQDEQNSTQKSLSPISNTESVYTSHSSLFNLFSSNGAKQRKCSFKLNKRSTSNDK